MQSDNRLRVSRMRCSAKRCTADPGPPRIGAVHASRVYPTCAHWAPISGKPEIGVCSAPLRFASRCAAPGTREQAALRRTPPFPPRRAALTAESAAGCPDFSHTSRSRDINAIRNASGDSPAAMRSRAMNAIDLEARYSAHNYAPLPVVLTRGQGAHLWDTAGRRYVDMMSAYSAASHGHGHPRILAALTAQAKRLAVPSRAYHNDRL